MFEEITLTKLLIQERIDRAEQARRTAAVRRPRRHALSDRLRRFADRLDS
jgi:hypothetical protein